MAQKMAVKISAVVIAGALTAASWSLMAANSTTIGMVSSGPGQASVDVDGVRVSTNATLFDGSLVSANGYSRLQLNSGTRVNLSADSKVRVFASHASLEGGSSEFQSSSKYTVDARTLKIELTETGSVARVGLDGDKRVLVTAVSAPVNVWNGTGVLVARVMPNMPMSFLPQAAGSTAYSLTGCVVNKSNAAVQVDSTGNQVFELRSTVKTVDLRKFIGKRAKATGTILSSAKPVTGATQVVDVATIEAATGASCNDVAARINATTSAAGIAAGGAAAAAGAGAAGAGAAAGAAGAAAGAAGAAAGISGAVIGGVAAAAAVGVGVGVGVSQSGTPSP